MKELSIEKKAKRYDEALERAKELHKNLCDCGVSVITKDIEEIFPELIESEDERIRKEILEYFRQFKNEELRGVDISDWIAWLEKQAEQKSFARYKVGDTIYYNSFGRLVSFTIANIVEDGTDNPMYEDKDGNSVFQNDIVEQKPAETIDLRTWKYIVDTVLTEREGIGQYIDSPFTEEVAKKLQKIFGNIEQKYAWSEEDEKLRIQCLDLITNFPSPNGKIDWTGCQNWLKSLKDKVQPQPQQKWSEEDEEHIKSLLERLEGMCKKGATFTMTRFAVSEDEDWLKHLKDRVQPKQEWNEEDEDRLSDAIFFVREYQIPTRDKKLLEVAKKAEEWLKSLRPQNRWKPSAFHLECIEDAISLYEKHGINAIGLKEILEELKKLK